MSAAKIKVLCVDDSALIRDLLTEIINSQPDMEVVAVAPDPIAARDLIKQHNPDVLTLDVEMPRMDGLDFLERLMRLRPMPVLMVSSLTQSGSEITLRALELGATAVIMVHNHPSGDPTPLKADIQMTHQLRDIGPGLGERGVRTRAAVKNVIAVTTFGIYATRRRNYIQNTPEIRIWTDIDSLTINRDITYTKLVRRYVCDK